jgi:hypothetical protein
MNDSIDWSDGNNFASDFLRAVKAIESSTTTPVPNQLIISNNLYGKLSQLFSDEQKPMKVEIEEYTDE